MELHQLRYFVAVAEAGTVSRGAQRCGVAQPSLSQQLSKLETTLGVRLFDRLGRGVALTDAGRALLPRARRILAEVRDAEEKLAGESTVGGSVSIGAIPTMAPLLPPALDQLRSQLPSVKISIREDFTERLVEAVVDNELDCALMSAPIDHPLIGLEILGQEELVFATPASFPVEPPSQVSITDVRDQPTVSLHEIHCLGKQIQGFCAGRQLAPRVVCRSTQLSTILDMVSLGMGVSIVPEMTAAAQPSTRSPACRYLRLKSQRPTRDIAVAWRQDRTHSHSASVFVEAVRANLNTGKHKLKDVTRRRA